MRRLVWASIGELAICGACCAQATPHQHNHPHPDPIVVGLPDPAGVRGLLVKRKDEPIIDGFARRIVEEAMQDLGLTVRFEPLLGTDGLEHLARGAVDAVSPMSVQEPRLSQVEFTSPLIVMRGAVFSRLGVRPASTLDELRGGRVGVARAGLAHEWCIEQSLPATRFTTIKELLEAARTGEIDYALTTQLTARVRIEELGMKGKLREGVLEERSFGRAFAVAVRPDEPILAAELSAAFERLRTSGRYDALYERWLEPYQPRGIPPRVPWRVVWVSALAALAALIAAGTGWWGASRRARARGAALIESEARLRGVTEASPALVYSYLVRPDGTRQLLFANPRQAEWQARFPCLDLGSEYSRSIRPEIHPDDVAGYDAATAAARASRARFEAEFRLRDRDGRWRWVHSTTEPKPVADGIIWNAVMLDVSDVRQAQERIRESEAKYRAIFDRSEDAIVVFLPAGETVIDANERALAIYGYTRGEFVGRSLELVSTDVPRGRARIDEMLATGLPASFVSRQRRADGRLIDVEISASVVEMDGQRCILTINRDVTESRRAAEARDRERRLFLGGPVVMFRWGHDPSWPVEYVSENVTQFGYSRDRFSADLRSFASIIHPEDLPRVEAGVRAADESGVASIDQSLRVRLSCGRWQWLQVHLVLVRDASGAVTHREGYALDDTVRREAAELVRTSEQRYRDFVSQTTEGVWRVEVREPVPTDLPPETQLDAWFRTGYFAECNDAFARMYGVESAEGLVGAPLGQLLPPEDPRNREYLAAFIEAGYRLRNAESFERAADGSGRVFLNSLVGIIENGRLVRAWGTQLDVTELRSTTEALQQSQARLTDILRALPDIVLGLDRDGRVLDVHGSDPAALYADPGSFVGRHLSDVMPRHVARDLLDAVARASRSGVPESVEYEIELAGGPSRFEARLVANAGRGATVVIRDITAREEARRRAEQLERDLQHTRRVESLGLMAGGIAHDFNNLLAGIVGNAELAVGLTVGDAPRRLLQSVITACRHASDLTRQLLAYAGKSVIRPTNLDLATTMGDLIHTVRPRLGDRLVATLEPAPVRGDATLIRQTLLNILVNAADAVADRPGGVVVIETGAREFGADELRTAAGAPPPPARYAFVRVRDSGAGIDADVLPRIFEPFFSTKSEGRGLGLSVAQRAAIDHGGALLVESAPGRGATFTLLLPPSTVPTPLADASTTPSEPIEGLGRRALVVDDQPLVLGVARRMLERSGWTTLGAASASEAIDAMSTQGPFDLVLVDLTMPDGSGTEVVAKGRAVHASQRFVVMSGYQPADARADCPFLLKPFTMDELHAAILACEPATPSPRPATASPP